MTRGADAPRVVAALACGAGVVALAVSSDHQDANTVWAVASAASKRSA
jgi:hypothetical protein